MIYSRIALSVLTLCMATQSVVAHEPLANESELRERKCSAPIRPENDQNDQQWKAFVQEVESFRTCVSDKLQWHELAAVRHNEDARLAVKRWNEFVRSSLNAPEDFPWPPEDK